MARYVEQGGVSSHYGDFYRITRDSYGVNLSALERRQCSLDKPLERSFGSIRKWLHGKFNVNPKTHLLTVHTVTSKRVASCNGNSEDSINIILHLINKSNTKPYPELKVTSHNGPRMT